MKDRPPRRMPQAHKVAKYHGVPVDQCAKCLRTTLRPHRAHVIDRALGGLDHEANLRLLCADCHYAQPSFAPGQEDEALAWFSVEWDPPRDEIEAGWRELRRERERFHREQLGYLEHVLGHYRHRARVAQEQADAAQAEIDRLREEIRKHAAARGVEDLQRHPRVNYARTPAP